jgi:hypothetical protein
MYRVVSDVKHYRSEAYWHTSPVSCPQKSLRAQKKYPTVGLGNCSSVDNNQTAIWVGVEIAVKVFFYFQLCLGLCH